MIWIERRVDDQLIIGSYFQMLRKIETEENFERHLIFGVRDVGTGPAEGGPQDIVRPEAKAMPHLDIPFVKGILSVPVGKSKANMRNKPLGKKPV